MSNESFERKLELCLQKLNREIDLDWVEIVELLNLDCSADHLRKNAYGIKEITDDTITFVNPWNSAREFTITKDELYNHDPAFGLSGYSIQE